MDITDDYGRRFETLRISLTGKCNMACTYCVESEDKMPVSKISKPPLSVDELGEVVYALHSMLPISTIRLTGGEPALYPDLVPLILKLQPLKVKLKMTTNGLLLKNILNKLPRNSIESINVSIDAMDEEVFYKITKRKGLKTVLEGIDYAQNIGIGVKINAVIIKAVNENQILPLVEYAFNKNLTIRFLEVMQMGHLYHHKDSIIYQEEILQIIGSKYQFYLLPKPLSDTAQYYRTGQGHIFGIIANESSPFCSGCNRLRLDSYGNIYGCLSHNEPIHIVSHLHNNNKMADILHEALLQKQPAKFEGSTLSMLDIGG
ncbi:MAG: GTP 3',8-cyclase MoaA [Cytophagales bacterium]|nr:GTP 3',8-cyclase MoaA [Cytophagales bacterium]